MTAMVNHVGSRPL